MGSSSTAFEIVSLPLSFDVGKSFVGLQGIVAGYGKLGDCKTNDRQQIYEWFKNKKEISAGPTAVSPHWARYEILSLRDCQNFFMKNFTEYSGQVICGRGIRAATCEGDSGQALVVFRKGKKKLIGIVSNGYESCETVGEPEIFTRVDGYLDFIEETIKLN